MAGMEKYFNNIHDALKAMLIICIKIYKNCISPFLPNTCRFYPTCSTYAIQAIEKKGIIKGLLVAVYRISRCNPFSKGGHDPL